MTKTLVYKTVDGAVVYRTNAHPHLMPWVGQRPVLPWAKGPFIVEQVHGTQDGYEVVLGALA